MSKGIVVLYLLLLNPLFAETLYFESGEKKNTLIELYTSEGCSSCPPAEKYLNNLKHNKNLWKGIFPLALHVDYWDYIGWKDPFATKKYGQRQSLYAKLKRASTVYTPAFIVNGTSWRPGLFSQSLPKEKRLAGNLDVSIEDKLILARYKIKNKTPLKLNVAILGMGLNSYIERGENKGRTAEHEFVVVGYDSANSNDLNWKITLPELHYKKSENYAVVVWISDLNDPTPLQVTGGVLPSFYSKKFKQ